MKLRNALTLAALALLLLPVAPAAAQPIPADIVTVGSGTVPAGSTVDIPIYIRDTSGTPVGLDQPPGSHIQSYSIAVNYAPGTAVQTISIGRSGITTSLTPAFEATPSGPGSISIIDTFSESTNPIPFTLNGAPPGNIVAHLLLTVPVSTAPGTIITLTLDPALTQLSNDGGTPGSMETQANGSLLLVNGSYVVTASVPTMSPWLLVLLAISIAVIGVRLKL